MSIKNQFLKHDLMNAKEEYEDRESLLNKKMASIEHENKALHKLNDKMYNTAKSNSSLFQRMNNAIEDAKHERNEFVSTLDHARQERSIVIQEHDRLFDENADLKRRLKELEDQQRSNEDVKQRLEDLQQRSHSLSHTTSTKHDPTNDSSSSNSTKSVASHSRSPDLDDLYPPTTF